MTKRGLIILIVAVLAVGGAAAAIASSIGDSSSEPAVHTMPNGETMQDESMEEGSGGMPGTEHQMPYGETMGGSESEMHGGSPEGMGMGG